MKEMAQSNGVSPRRQDNRDILRAMQGETMGKFIWCTCGLKGIKTHLPDSCAAFAAVRKSAHDSMALGVTPAPEAQGHEAGATMTVRRSVRMTHYVPQAV